MAKSKPQPMPQKQEKYPYPSRYGSHHSMIVSLPKVPCELRDSVGVGQCVCEDENGMYITEYDRIDNGCADPNRYRESRLKLAS